jgi:hypothetical protein
MLVGYRQMSPSARPGYRPPTVRSIRLAGIVRLGGTESKKIGEECRDLRVSGE